MNFAFFVEVLTQYEMKLFLVLCTDGFIYFFAFKSAIHFNRVFKKDVVEGNLFLQLFAKGI